MLYRRISALGFRVASLAIFAYLEGHGSTFHNGAGNAPCATCHQSRYRCRELVKDTVLRLIEDETSFRRPAPELPIWDLGTIGSLHRRDLYDDAR
jgi:hypothetical protein